MVMLLLKAYWIFVDYRGNTGNYVAKYLFSEDESALVTVMGLGFRGVGQASVKELRGRRATLY